MLRAIIFSVWMIITPGHVSMTSITQVQGTDSLKVTCRMRFDDFLKDLQTIDDDRNLKKIFSHQPFPNDLVNQYFNSKVFIYINKKLLIGKLLTVDIAEDDIVMNLLFRSDKTPKSITIRNTILATWYSDQSNLTIIKINNLEKGITFTPKYSEETIIVKQK